MGVRDNGIPPSEFWGMSFVELLSLYADPLFRPKGITREKLDELMAKFPD